MEKEKKRLKDRLFDLRLHQNALVISLLSAFISIPVFIVVYRHVPVWQVEVMDSVIPLDHILLFLVTFAFFYYLILKFRFIVLILSVSGMVVLTVTNFAGWYTLDNFAHDYRFFLYSLGEETVEQRFQIDKAAFTKEEALRKAVDYNHPVVRNWAASMAFQNFESDAVFAPDRKLVQYFSIYKEIRRRWAYVYDPSGEDYYAKASETISQLEVDDRFKGDCDDYSILMAACMKAIGGEVRLIRTKIKNGEDQIGHMYPEVKVGSRKDIEMIGYLIKHVLFENESSGKEVNYYLDSKGFVWMNFDYNDHYPGGPYQSDIREVEIVI